MIMPRMIRRRRLRPFLPLFVMSTPPYRHLADFPNLIYATRPAICSPLGAAFIWDPYALLPVRLPSCLTHSLAKAFPLSARPPRGPRITLAPKCVSHLHRAPPCPVRRSRLHKSAPAPP